MTLRSIKQTNRRVKTKTTVMTPKTFTPAIIQDIEATAADVVRLTFNTRVQPSHLPTYKAGASGDIGVTNMAAVSSTVVDLTFSDDVAGTSLIVKEGDPGIRTHPGGFVPAGTYAIPTFP